MPTKPIDDVDYGCRRLVRRGNAKLDENRRHPAIRAINHLVNILQRLGYPFSSGDRKQIKRSISAVGTRGYMICPNCLSAARFMPVNPKADLKAWFCNCSYEDGHQNGLKSHD